jgi:hypothetical protein
MNLRYGAIYICTLCLAATLAGNPAPAQTRVGEAGPQPVGNTVHGGDGLRVN